MPAIPVDNLFTSLSESLPAGMWRSSKLVRDGPAIEVVRGEGACPLGQRCAMTCRVAAEREQLAMHGRGTAKVDQWPISANRRATSVNGNGR